MRLRAVIKQPPATPMPTQHSPAGSCVCVCVDVWGVRGELRSRVAFRQPKRSLKQNEMNKCMRTSVYLEQAKGCLSPPPSLTLWDCVGEGATPWELATKFAKWPTKRFVMDALAARIET